MMEEEQIKNLRNQDILINEEEDSSQRKKEWQETVKYQENICNNKAYSRSEKEALEEELTRLALVITENKFKIRNMLTQTQETEDEIRLGLVILRADLKRSDDQRMRREEIINWRVMENMIKEGLTKLEEYIKEQNLGSKNELKLEQEKRQAEETEYETLRDVLETQVQRGQVERDKKAERPPLKCYYCHEEGHFKRECPQRSNKKERESRPWIRKQITENQFKQKTGFWHEQYTDDMSVGTTMAWPCDESSGEDIEKK